MAGPFVFQTVKRLKVTLTAFQMCTDAWENIRQENQWDNKKKRHASLAGPSFLFFGAKICTRVSGVGRSLLADHLSHISQRHFVWSHTAVITLNVQVIISPMQHWKAAIRNTLTEKEEGIRAHRPSAGID